LARSKTLLVVALTTKPASKLRFVLKCTNNSFFRQIWQKNILTKLLHGHELVKINNEPIKHRQALKAMQIPVRMAPTNGCRYKDTNISSGRSLKNNNCKFWANLRGKPNIL